MTIRKTVSTNPLKLVDVLVLREKIMGRVEPMKKNLLALVLTFLSLTAFSQFSSYKFSGNAKDSIGSYHGVVNGATLTKDRFGVSKAAYSFNSSNKDYIAVHPSPNIGGKAFGLSVWFNALPSNGAQMKIIDWYACGFSTCLGSAVYSIGLKNDKLHFYIRSNGTTLAFDTTFSTVATFDDGIWHHTVLTFDSTSGNVAIYIDNQVFHSFNRPFGNMSPVPDNVSVPMSIGRQDESRVGRSWQHFNGKIDDILIYNEFLSASKVDSLFKVGHIGYCPNTYTLSSDTMFGCFDTISLTLSGSDTLFDYYLLDTVSKIYADGPISGTGSALTFKAFNSSKYKVVTESNVSNSLKFDGSNDYVAVDNTTGFPMGNASRTMECWMKTTASGKHRVMFDYGDRTKDNNRSSLQMDPNGRIYFSGYHNDLAGTSKMNDGKWHHAAVTYDGLTLKLYVDGKLDNSKKISPLATSGNFFKIGVDNQIATEYFKGEIKKVRIWDASFNIETIQQLMNACVTGKESNLVAAYNFTSDSSSTLLDATKGLKKGTLTNMDTIKAWQVAAPFVVSNTVSVNKNKNLIKNGDASNGLKNWTLSASGGNGWATDQGVFRTSYEWCRKYQVIDLLAEGYSTAVLDASPDIFVSDDYIGFYNYSDSYYLKVELRNASNGVIATYNTNTLTTNSDWQTASTTFSGYGPGVRYIYFEHGGKDIEYWQGHYGPMMDNATVNLFPTISAGIDQEVCSGTAVTLSGSGSSSYTWDNGVKDGVSFIPLVTRTYSAIGTYDYGCTNTDSVLVTVNPNPNSSFTLTPDGFKSGRITLSTLAGKGLTYQWFFGDGTSDTSRNPIHTYTSNGNYSIKLIVMNAFGCMDSSTQVYNLTNVGINDTKSEFSIYPNPTSKELNIQIESNLLGSQFKILNTLGQELKQGELTSSLSSIDVSELSKGYYVLRIEEGNHSYKFLVE